MRHSLLKRNKVEIIKNRKGFTLVELSIVLVIIGIILGGATVLFQSSVSTARLSTTRKSLDVIKDSVINYAVTYNRLPCPDTVLRTQPPNTWGSVCRATPGACSACATPCANPPCWVPFLTLNLQLKEGRDSFNNSIRFDVSSDNTGTATGGLTNTTADTFCGVLYEYMSHATDVNPPVAAGNLPPSPLVTNSLDAADDGRIGISAGNPQGYYLAAVAIAETPVSSPFGDTIPIGLNGKNNVSTQLLREYEMANKDNVVTPVAYGNLVAELTYGDLYNKACSSQKTKIRIQNNTPAVKYARLTSSTSCMQVNIAAQYDLFQGTSVIFFTDSTCTTACGAGTTFTFTMAAANDAGTVDWLGTGGGTRRNGIVQITTAACTLSNL